MEHLVPIGSDCSVALYLRDKNIRKVAFPFDWVVAPMQNVIHLIENDFEDFLKKDNLIFLPQASRKMVIDDNNEGVMIADIITPCYCKKYNLLLPHDFSKTSGVTLPEVQEKYQHRIKRLLQLLSSNKTIVFISNNAPTSPKGWRAQQYKQASGNEFVNKYDDWKNRLSQTLENKYPNLKYKTYTLQEFKKR